MFKNPEEGERPLSNVRKASYAGEGRDQAFLKDLEGKVQ